MIRLLSIIIIIFFSSCSNFQECNDIELKIKEICIKTDSVYIIPLASLTNFEWDVLYVIGGPTIDNEVEEFIGIGYKKTIQDNRRQYIFIKDNQIVKEYSSYCNLNLSKLPSYTIGKKYLNTSQIFVQKKETEEHFTYRVEEIPLQIPKK